MKPWSLYRLIPALPAILLAAPLWAQEAGNNAAKPTDSMPATQAGSANETPQPQSPADKEAPQRNVWSSPLSGIAASLGLTDLFARLGLNASVAAAVGGVILVLPMLVVIFFAWQFVRRRRVLDPDRNAR